MFCPNCGSKNEDSALFCENCGAPMEEAVQETYKAADESTVRTAGKQLSRQKVILAVEVLLVCLALYGLYRTAEKNCSPDSIAEKYFVSRANADWNEIYNCLDIEKSEFTSEEMFALANRGNSLGEISNYRVNPLAPDFADSSLGTTVNIDYRLKDDPDSEHSFEVSMNRQAGKSCLFFDKWKVGTEGWINRDFYFYVPAGANISVDGIELGKSCRKEKDDEDGYEAYCIPCIFTGFHDLKVTMEDMEDVEQTVKIEKNDDSYYTGEMHLKKEVLDALKQKAGENMQQIYVAAISGKSFPSVEKLFTAEKDTRQEIRKDYENLVSGFHDSSSQLDKVSFDNIRVSADGSSVSILFDYTVDYTYEDWWGDEEHGTYEGSEELSFDYSREDGSWVQAGLGCTYLYY